MQRYSFQKYNEETMSRAVAKSLAISTKHCIEITTRIRRRKLDYAKKLLKDVIDMKVPLRFTRFTGDVGHRRGMGAGRYPIKACKEVLKLIESCEANAQFKGLNTGSMVVVHANAQQGSRQMHYGRQRRRLMKRTHLEIVLEETAKKETKSTPAKADKVKKEAKVEADVKKPAKPEAKPAAAKAVQKKSDDKSDSIKDTKPKADAKPAAEAPVEKAEAVKEDAKEEDPKKEVAQAAETEEKTEDAQAPDAKQPSEGN